MNNDARKMHVFRYSGAALSGSPQGRTSAKGFVECMLQDTCNYMSQTNIFIMSK